MLLRSLPTEVRYVLGDRHYNDPDLRLLCEQYDRSLVTTQYDNYPHTDQGAPARNVFHKLRLCAIKNFSEQFNGISDVHDQVSTKGLASTQRFALGAIFLCQIVLLYRFQHGFELRTGLKAFIKAA